MSTPIKDPNEKGKNSFWKKLSEQRAARNDDSLVSAIVRQAEKKASGEIEKNADVSENSGNEVDENRKARALLGNAKTLLTFVILATIGFWIYFSATLGASNYFFGKFDSENSTVELEHKTESVQQARTDLRDIQKFSKLLQIENLANRVLALDLENPILNYERPAGEKVVASEDSTKILFKTLNDANEVVYLAESEITNLEKEKAAQVTTARAALAEIAATSTSFAGTLKTDAAVENQLEILVAEVEALDPAETDFPSAVLKSHFAAAQSAASEILKKVKSLNLANLVADIKKQINSIDTTELDASSQEIVAAIQTSLANLSENRASSFDTASSEIRALDISQISDNEIYQKIVQIVGDPRAENENSDLATAATITRNIGRVNTISELRAQRVAWSTVIERAEKIVRLGADLARDTDGTPLDATRDIDPDSALVSLTAYSGKSKNGQIEIRGEVLGKNSYSARSFSLLADIIDAFEGSKYFKDVRGFAFAREEDRSGEISSPLNLELSLQNPAVADSRDVAAAATRAAAETVEDATDDGAMIDTTELQNIDFNLRESAASEPTDENELTGVFDALDATLN